jgi:sarcosine oxidase subunit gamma
LERICPIDLHPQAFAVGAVARTLMDHLNVIILREGGDTFLLMSARSSARSFWHAVETSIRNIA